MKKSKLVWIIDDDPGILEVMQIIVKEEGYKTKEINNTTLLDQELQRITPDLILLDILMSGNDGKEIAKKLKSEEKTKHIPIIMVSADLHVDKKANEAQADGYLQKPFNINDLVVILRKYL